MIAQTVGRVGSIWLLAGSSNEDRGRPNARASHDDALNPQSGAMPAERVASERIRLARSPARALTLETCCRFD